MQTAEEGTVHLPFLYEASDNKLQEFLLLGLFVAGKNAVVQQHKLNWFLELTRNNILPDHPEILPFNRLAYVPSSVVEKNLRHVGAGQYRRLTESIIQLATAIQNGELNLRTCNREELVQFPGIGYKTASFYLIYTRRDHTYACLDTHILRWLREERGYPDAPKTSPQSRKQYIRWEAIYLTEARDIGADPTELDFELWLKYSTKKK